MERKQTPGKHWDREQWAPDTEGPPEEPQGEVWNRHQWAPDNTGTDADRTTLTDADRETLANADRTTLGDADSAALAEADRTGEMDRDIDPVDPIDDAAPGGLSGHGQPSGESHWERNDPAD